MQATHHTILAKRPWSWQPFLPAVGVAAGADLPRRARGQQHPLPVLLQPGHLPSTPMTFLDKAFLVLPMTLVIILGNIDISVGSTVALSAVIMAVSYNAGLPMVPAILLCLAVATACGSGQRPADDAVQGAVLGDRDPLHHDHLPRHRLRRPGGSGLGQIPGVVLAAGLGDGGEGPDHADRLRGLRRCVLAPAAQDQLRPQDLRHGQQPDGVTLLGSPDGLHHHHREPAHRPDGGVHRPVPHLAHGQHPPQRGPGLRTGGHHDGGPGRGEHPGRQGEDGGTALGHLHHRLPQLRAGAGQHPGPDAADHRRDAADPLGTRFSTSASKAGTIARCPRRRSPPLRGLRRTRTIPKRRSVCEASLPKRP